MNVLVWAREATRAQARADGYATAASKDAFFAECDVISLHMRLVDATRGIVTAADLARMKPTALHRQHQPRAADRAGRAGRGAAGGPARHGGGRRLRGRAGARSATIRCSPCRTSCATPHIGYVTRDEYEIQFADIFDQIVAYAAGTPINVVNPDVLERRAT